MVLFDFFKKKIKGKNVESVDETSSLRKQAIVKSESNNMIYVIRLNTTCEDQKLLDSVLDLVSNNYENPHILSIKIYALANLIPVLNFNCKGNKCFINITF